MEQYRHSSWLRHHDQDLDLDHCPLVRQRMEKFVPAQTTAADRKNEENREGKRKNGFAIPLAWQTWCAKAVVGLVRSI
jgi:hypothetical protein